MFRNSLLLATAVGLAVHLMFPLAPPRMMPDFVDVTTTVGPDPYSVPGSGQANQFAAMPSLHVAWAVIVATSARAVLRSRLVRSVAIGYAVVTSSVVLLVAHHYLLDVLVALAVAAAARRLGRGGIRPAAPRRTRKNPGGGARSLTLPPTPITSHLRGRPSAVAAVGEGQRAGV